MALTDGQSGHLADHVEHPMYVQHGATAATARPTLGSAPTAATVCFWDGSVDPDNKVSGDYWWDTTDGVLKRYNGSTWVQSGASQTVVDVKRAATQSIPNATVTAVSFDTETLDPHGYFDAGTPTRITVPAAQAGKRHRFYVVNGFAGNTTGRRQQKLTKNGTTDVGYMEDDPPSTTSLYLRYLANDDSPAAGDYYELLVYQSSGGALNTAATGQLRPRVVVAIEQEAS